MVISLTESGVVCTRELLFTQSGMLEKCSERQKKANAKSARTSRRLPSGAGLSVATGDNSGAGGTSTAVAAVFLIGKEWKEHLARAATLAAASQSGSNLQGRRGQQEQHFGGVGRRLSAFSQFMAETKSTARASLEGSSNDHRRNSLRASDLPTARRKTVARRASQVTPVDTKQRGGRLRSDTIDSINTGLSHNPFGVPGVPSNRPGNLRNRRSSIRGGFKAERASIREAAWDPLVDGYRASLLSFSTNHSAFTPPQHALPHSYSLSKAGFVQGRSAQQGNRLASQSEEASSFGSKIWGLRITDLRLLFTIEIRDVLYGYFARGMDLFEPTVVESQSEAQRRRPSNVNAKMEKEGGKATIYDFLQPPTDKEAANARKPPQADEQRNRFGFSPIRAMQATLDASSDAMLHFLSSRQERTGSSPRAAAEAAAAVKELSEKAYTNSAAGGSGGDLSPISKVRFQQRDGSLTQEASGYKSPAKESLDASSSGDEAKPARLSLKTPSASPRASSSPRPAAATPVRTPLGAASAKERSSAAGSSQPEPSKSAKNNSKKPTSQYFFIVELIDPQVNFLDVKTHSSLIIVAGLSSVEGKRFTDATLAPSHDMSGAQQGPNNIRDSMATRGSIAQQALQEPKRQQELRLRMDGVSAFTVPSNSSNDPDDDSDTVHWKQMDSTSGVNVGVGLGVDESGYLGNRRSAIPKESPFMRMAIKDFQIRALYIFWTDVTVKEAKTMYLYPSKEELVCTFKLELPVICVDILSWQFYVIMHVVRNVLLVPPPASATRKSPTQSEAEEAEKNKVLELLRDPVLLAKHELRTNMNIPLDLKHKLSRDELKLLIEENLAGAMMNMELGSARFVEVFVGSCTWILRVNSGSPFSVDSSVNGKESNREWEKEQLKVELTGVHATFSYGEDRFVFVVVLFTAFKTNLTFCSMFK